MLSSSAATSGDTEAVEAIPLVPLEEPLVILVGLWNDIQLMKKLQSFVKKSF